MLVVVKFGNSKIRLFKKTRTINFFHIIALVSFTTQQKFVNTIIVTLSNEKMTNIKVVDLDEM
jgi:hypothetical protein